MKRRLATLVEFFAPLPLAAVLLMGLNDHFGKARFHNEVTGKLSDVAVCFVLPLYLSALLGLVTSWSIRARLGAGSLITAVMFTVLELSDTAGRLFASCIVAVGAPLGVRRVVLTRDLTDLFTLALIPLAWWYGQRRASRFSSEPIHSRGDR